MSDWLEGRLDIWLPIYAKWQIYFIAESIRSGSEPTADSPEHAYWEDDMRKGMINPGKEEITFKVNILRANPRNPIVLKGLKHHVVPEFKRIFLEKVPDCVKGLSL